MELSLKVFAGVWVSTVGKFGSERWADIQSSVYFQHFWGSLFKLCSSKSVIDVQMWHFFSTDGTSALLSDIQLNENIT